MTVENSKKNYRIPLFCLVTVLYWTSLYTYVPVLTLYIESLGASHKLAGMIVGSYGFVQMLLRIPIGVMSDRFHRRKLFISLGLSFSLFSALGLLLFKDLTLILVFRGLAGVAAATWVDFTILFSSYYKKEETSKAIGTINFYNTIGQTIGVFVGSYAADAFGWESPFIMAVVIAAVAVILSFFLVEKKEADTTGLTFVGFKNVATNKTLLYVSIIAILSQVVTFSTVFGFTPMFASQYLHASKFQVGLLTVFSSLPSAIASLLAGRTLSKRYGEKNIIVFGFILTGIFTITIPFTSFSMLLFTQIMSGFGKGLAFPMLMGLSIKDMPQNKRATAMGFFQSIYGLGMFIGPVLMGVIGDLLSLQQGFIIIGIIALLTALFSKIILKDTFK